MRFVAADPRSRRGRVAPVGMSALAVAVLAALAIPAGPAVAKPGAVGSKLPFFILRELDGTAWTLRRLAHPPDEPSYGRQRRVLVLDFFSTSCEPCKQGLARLEAFDRKYRGRGVRTFIIAMPGDDPQGREAIARYFAEHKVSMPVLIDEFSYAAKALGVLRDGVAHLPTTILVDPNGIIRAHLEGVVDRPLEEAFGKALGRALGVLGRRRGSKSH